MKKKSESSEQQPQTLQARVTQLYEKLIKADALTVFYVIGSVMYNSCLLIGPFLAARTSPTNGNERVSKDNSIENVVMSKITSSEIMYGVSESSVGQCIGGYLAGTLCFMVLRYSSLKNQFFKPGV